MLRPVCLLLMLIWWVLPPALHAQPAVEIQKSLVRISTTGQNPDYRVPWNPGAISGGIGAGFVIAGERIMTNAHVVSNARFLEVQREGDPKRYVAKVRFIAHDCDLAVLEVEDANFFKTMLPLSFDALPEIESEVSVYGYPIGGERLSVTRGVISRIDFQAYSHSGVDSHLAIQIDAAINPGNSGGPVLQAGKVVGVAFQGYSGDVAQNVGYMIPVPVIKRFLQDIEDGRYDKYVDLAVGYFKLQNPAMRKALGLEDDDRGVVVSTVVDAGASAGVLEVGDVLMAIDRNPIASDGFVELEGERVEMPEVVERKFKGDEVTLDIIRANQPMEVKVKLKPAWPFSMQANAYDVKPRFVLFGGLLFQPLSRELLRAYGIGDLRVRYLYDNFVSNKIYKDHPEVVLLTNVLADPITTYLGDFRFNVVHEINGRKIRTLEDVAEAFKEPAEYYVIKMLGEGRPVVLERKLVEEARDRIKQRYQVTLEQNLSDSPVQ